VIADSTDRLRSFVDGSATLAVTLGPLDADEVRSNLAEGADGLVPPLTDDELDHYVKAAVDEPALVKALFDVFRAVKESTIS
jgi:hypothetical protein